VATIKAYVLADSMLLEISRTNKFLFLLLTRRITDYFHGCLCRLYIELLDVHCVFITFRYTVFIFDVNTKQCRLKLDLDRTAFTDTGLLNGFLFSFFH